MKRRIGVLLTALALTVSAAAPAQAYTIKDFSDVPTSHWAYTAVMEMADQKVVNGMGKGQFGPEVKVSAAMFLTLVGRIAFPNMTVTGSDWSGPYVTAAQNSGWLEGTTIDTANLGADITRYDMAVVLAAAGRQLGLPETRAEVYKIKDYAAIPIGYTSAVERVYGQGLITGDGAGNFNGTATMSRAEAAMVLWRLKGLLAGAKAGGTGGDVLSGQEIFEKCSPSVFSITTRDAEGDLYAQGSGFIIDSSGLAVTNYHVLRDAMVADATLADGSCHMIVGVVAFDEELDYAVIKVGGGNYPALQIGDSKNIKSGETVYAIGNPQGLSNTISDGVISNPRRDNFGGMVQISVPISGGSSGGALLNAAGEVIGITTGSLESGQNLNFATPMDLLESKDELMRTFLEEGFWGIDEYAEYNEYLAYENVPDAFEELIDEWEPNNFPDQATRLYNGDSVVGVIDDSVADCFVVHCNTPGAIEVVLFSDSAPKYVRDLILEAKHQWADSEDGASSDYRELDDGTVARYLRYVVREPGVYYISLLSNSLYKTEKLNTDYMFYYLFTPGDTGGENTKGTLSTAVESPEERRESAFALLKDWIAANANDSVSGDKAYTERNIKDSGVEEYILIDGWEDAVVAGYTHLYGGTTSRVLVVIPLEGSNATVSYYYYRAQNNSTTPDVSGSAYIPIGEISEQYAFRFERVEGYAPAMSVFEETAHYNCLFALAFVDYILEEHLGSYGYTIADLGYTSLYD